MKAAIIFVFILALFSCENPAKDIYDNLEHSSGDMAIAFPQDHPGKQLMENNCYLCHNPKTSKDKIIAPPLALIKASYIAEGISKSEFVDDMVLWIKNPNEDTSRLPEAIKEYGLMPYQFYPENTLRQIADYMFDNKIEQPEWFTNE